MRHEFEKLKATAERIYDNYNVVEPVNEEMEKVWVMYFLAPSPPSHLNTPLPMFIVYPPRVKPSIV